MLLLGNDILFYFICDRLIRQMVVVNIRHGVKNVEKRKSFWLYRQDFLREMGNNI